jgi:hypothetical protein
LRRSNFSVGFKGAGVVGFDSATAGCSVAKLNLTNQRTAAPQPYPQLHRLSMFPTADAVEDILTIFNCFPL